MNFSLISIIILCFGILIVYYKTTRFDKGWGIILFLLGGLVFFLRLFYFESFPFFAIFNPLTLSRSALLLSVVFLLFLLVTLVKTNLHNWIRKYLILLVPYLLFGALQQIFFLWIFTDTVLYFSGNFELTFFLSVLFFTVFHLNWEKGLNKLLFLVIIFGVMNTYIYLFLGNIYPQMVFHGIMASFLFTAYSPVNQLEKRIGKLSAF